MKILVVSDIHGSLLHAQKAIEAFETHQADMMLMLGDFLYHGPRNPLPPQYDPMAVSQLLNRYADRILAVRGNCDSEVDQMILDLRSWRPTPWYSTAAGVFLPLMGICTICSRNRRRSGRVMHIFSVISICRWLLSKTAFTS